MRDGEAPYTTHTALTLISFSFTAAPVEKEPLGRPGNNVRAGVVGMPNVGKSTTFNIMCNMSVPAENFPFCTIDPTEARVELSDPNFKHLLEKFHPKSEVPAFLSVVDIAGLVKGAAEGEGLGNAFLSHINATDAIFNVVRVFEETMVSMFFSVFQKHVFLSVFWVSL